ncbi:MAG: TRAP transporter small permease subunit [Pseudomonadota bacterium]
MPHFDRVERGVERLAAGFAILGGLGLIFATLVTCLSILLKLTRRTLDATAGEAAGWIRPILGEEELVAYGVGLALFSALPWVMIRRGHIKIDLFEPLFGDRLNRLLDLLGDIALALIAYLIMTRQWTLLFSKPRGEDLPIVSLLLRGDMAEIADRLRTAQESQILGLPLWPTYIVAEVCVVAFFLTACFCVLRSARALGRSGR